MRMRIGQITAICTGWSRSGLDGLVTELDPPWEATPQMLEQLNGNPLVGGYRIRIFPREASSA